MATITETAPSLEEIESAVAKLTPGQRGVLIDRIREMDEEVVDPEVEAAWDTEIRRRIAEIDNGTAVLLDGEEVMARVSAQLGL